MNPTTRRTLETSILSTAELSELTGIPMVTLQQQAFRGQIECVRKGHTLLFDRRDFVAQIRQHAERKEEEHGGDEAIKQGRN